MTRMEHFVECIVGSQSWHVYAVKRSELSSERFNAAFSVGHGFVQTSEVLAKIPVLHGYIPMESQEPGEHGIQIWDFLEIHISARFSTFTSFTLSHYFKMGKQNQMLASHRWQYENLARRALLKADRGRRPVMTYFLWVVKGAPLL